MSGALGITLLFLFIWLWWDGLRTKENARKAGLRACQNAGVQFLDDTVQRQKIWLRRNSEGRVQICRDYRFEFASDGEQRYSGLITTQGQHVKHVDMEAYRI